MRTYPAPRPDTVARWLLGAAIFVGAAAPTAADEGPHLVRVEEDWELLVSEPDPNLNAPQVTCVASPTGDLAGYFAAIELNHRSQPDYSAGGVHLQLYYGDQPVASRSQCYPQELEFPGEEVRWTLVMYLDDGDLVVEVQDGESTTWGEFGGESLRLRLPTDLENLDGYAPLTSRDNSGVGYAGNRVSSLKLLRVRGQTDEGDWIESEETVLVHPKS